MTFLILIYYFINHSFQSNEVNNIEIHGKFVVPNMKMSFNSKSNIKVLIMDIRRIGRGICDFSM